MDNSADMGVPGLVASRTTSVSDGLLDVTVIRSVDVSSLRASLASESGRGTLDPEAFFHGLAREITIDADPPQRVVGDGEDWGTTPITVNVLASAARFVVSSQTAAGTGPPEQEQAG